jgi:hypothetical protein
MRSPGLAIVEAVLLSEGPIGSTEELARTLGLPNRFALGRLLREQGVPPLRHLYGWATVLSWVTVAEHRGLSLFRIAASAGRQPSSCYRFVKQVTGLPWRQVEARGSVWVEEQFVKRFRRIEAETAGGTERARARG